MLCKGRIRWYRAGSGRLERIKWNHPGIPVSQLSVKDTLHNISGCSIFSKLDLRMGFYQIIILITIRIKPHLRFKIGSSNSRESHLDLLMLPNSFIAIHFFLYAILRATVFIDDILIASKTTEDLFIALKEIFR